jgi:integrase
VDRPTGNRTTHGLPGLRAHERFVLASALKTPGAVSLDAAVMEVTEHWVECHIAGAITSFTLHQYSAQLRRFAGYAAACRVTVLADVDPRLCEDFCQAALAHGQGGAPSRRGQMPAVGTQSLRRSALRAMFRTCARIGLWNEDPTRYTRLAAVRRSRPLRPLTPTEMDAIRHHATYRPGETLLPALVALATTGAALSETAYVRLGDVDLISGTVHLPGMTRKYLPREVSLEPWQAESIAARIDALTPNRHKRGSTGDSDPLLVFERDLAALPPTTVSATQSQALLRLLARAGVNRRGSVQATGSSLQQYAANRVYAISGIEDVREVLGLRRLDSAAALVDPAWQASWADSVRNITGPRGDAR